jgi:hypothetical protein
VLVGSGRVATRSALNAARMGELTESKRYAVAAVSDAELFANRSVLCTTSPYSHLIGSSSFLILLANSFHRANDAR